MIYSTLKEYQYKRQAKVKDADNFHQTVGQNFSIKTIVQSPIISRSDLNFPLTEINNKNQLITD